MDDVNGHVLDFKEFGLMDYIRAHTYLSYHKTIIVHTTFDL